MNNQEYNNHIPTPLKPRFTDYGQVNLCQVDGVGCSEQADSATVIGDEIYNHTPTSLKPLITDHGQVNLCQVDGVGRNEADSAPVISQSFVVRIKDVPRILGEENSMLKNISEVSGASLSISVDMRNLMNRTVQINVWGCEEDVEEAETMILNVITEGYDNLPAFLPLIHGDVHEDVMVLPIHQALHLLKERSIFTIEAETFTWIDVDASKARKSGEAVEMDFHILGANRKDIDAAVALIHTIADQAEPTSKTKKKAWDGRNMQGAKGQEQIFKSFWNGMKSAWNKKT